MTTPADRPPLWWPLVLTVPLALILWRVALGLATFVICGLRYCGPASRADLEPSDLAFAVGLGVVTGMAWFLAVYVVPWRRDERRRRAAAAAFGLLGILATVLPPLYLTFR